MMMTKKIKFQDLDKRLGLLFQEALIESEVENFVSTLATADIAEVTTESVRVVHNQTSRLEPIALKDHPPIAALDQFFDSISAWVVWSKEHLENLGGTYGQTTVAKADSGRSSNQFSKHGFGNGTTADRIWKQGEMRLTLLGAGKRDFVVTLKIENYKDINGLRFFWADEKSLKLAHNDLPNLMEFSVKKIDDEHFRVMIPAGIYNKRMRAIAAAEKGRDGKITDVRILLPFVTKG